MAQLQSSSVAVQVTIYLSEGDEYQRRPTHMQILNYLRQENIANAVVVHAVAGFIGRSRVKTTTLVDAGGKLPLVVLFVDDEEHVLRVLPTLKQMAGPRLIVRENVVEHGAGLNHAGPANGRWYAVAPFPVGVLLAAEG